MSVTLLTSQADTSLLKDEASPSRLNICLMLVTLLTSQDEISPLNEKALRNIPAMFSTLLTSHADTSLLKDEASIPDPPSALNL